MTGGSPRPLSGWALEKRYIGLSSRRRVRTTLSSCCEVGAVTLESQQPHLSVGCPCRKLHGPARRAGAQVSHPRCSSDLGCRKSCHPPAANCSCYRGANLITQKYVAPTFLGHHTFSHSSQEMQPRTPAPAPVSRLFHGAPEEAPLSCSSLEALRSPSRPQQPFPPLPRLPLSHLTLIFP